MRKRISKKTPRERTAEAVIRQLERLAFADIRRVCKATGEPRPLDQISSDDAAAIKTVRRRKWTNKDGRPGAETIVELHDKLPALIRLGDHHGIWKQELKKGVRVFVLNPSGGYSNPQLEGQHRPLRALSPGTTPTTEVHSAQPLENQPAEHPQLTTGLPKPQPNEVKDEGASLDRYRRGAGSPFHSAQPRESEFGLA